MNMRRVDVGGEGVLFRFWRGWRVLFLVLLPWMVLSACGEEGGVVVDPLLVAGDGFLDQGRRVLFPESYWRGKVVVFGEAVEEARRRFQRETQSYHEKLQERRQEVMLVARRAKEEGDVVARREVVQQYRAELDPLRLGSRESGRALRRQMELLRLAQEQLDRVSH